MKEQTIGRRQLVAAAAGAFTIVRPQQVRGSQANSAMRLALLGCGNRGSYVTEAFVKGTNSRVVALADLFQDQLDAARKRFGVADGKLLFRGPSAYRQIAEAKGWDALILATPDYFHPEHLAAVVDAGRHVYCEKPAAVDVAGCKRFLEIGRRAEGRLSLDVGFNVRHAAPFAEVIRRVRAGAIGKIASGSTFYHSTALAYPDRPGASAVERRIRNFYWDRVLSGDVIVDQNIHIIDLCNWAIGAHPSKAMGTGGRKVRRDAGGDIWDHWALVFTYPGDVRVSFNSVQFGDRYRDVGIRLFGEDGVAESYYSGVARVVGREEWEWARPPRLGANPRDYIGANAFSGLQGAEARKAQAFVESIRSGRYHNESAIGAESALSAILGRMAAYEGREVTWEEMIASNQSYEGAIDLSTLA